MAVALTIPALGESIAEATIAKWLKQVGEPVAADEPVAELETDKVTVSLPAPQAGVLVAQHHPVGATVRVGDSIGEIDATAQSAAPQPAPQSAAPQPPPQNTAPQPPPQSAAPQPSPQNVAPQASSAPPFSTGHAQATGPGPGAVAGVPLTPTVRRHLREQGIDPTITPTSAAASPSTSAPEAAPRPPVPPAGAVAAQAAAGLEDVVPMSPLRKRIAERLVQAQHTAAILTTFNEVDMTQVMDLRARYQDDFVKKHGIKLGFMSFFARACVEALRAFPGLNAEVRGGDIVYKKYYDIGVAVGSGKGLVVPVLRGVEKLGFAQIEKGIAELANKAKDNKLTLPELAGGTFSITNGGIYGSMMSTPLLNMPQTGILGMHNIIRRPIAIGDEVRIRPMMYLALSYDHRVVDGREAVQFLVQVKERLEQPEKLLLGI